MHLLECLLSKWYWKWSIKVYSYIRGRIVATFGIFSIRLSSYVLYVPLRSPFCTYFLYIYTDMCIHMEFFFLLFLVYHQLIYMYFMIWLVHDQWWRKSRDKRRRIEFKCDQIVTCASRTSAIKDDQTCTKVEGSIRLCGDLAQERLQHSDRIHAFSIHLCCDSRTIVQRPFPLL